MNTFAILGTYMGFYSGWDNEVGPFLGWFHSWPKLSRNYPVVLVLSGYELTVVASFFFCKFKVRTLSNRD